MQQPIRNIELIKIFANAFVVWLVVMGFIPMDNTQQAVTLTMVMSAINLGGAMWQNNQTTPLAAPRDTDGETLTRSDNTPAKEELKALQTEAIAINKEALPNG